MKIRRIKSSGPVQLEDRIRFLSELQEGFLLMRDDSEIGSDCRIDILGGLTIGRCAHLSSQVCVVTHANCLEPLSASVASPLTIGDDVWVGARVLLLDSIGEIGDGAVIEAESSFTKSVPPREVRAGNQAHKIRMCTDSRARYGDQHVT